MARLAVRVPESLLARLDQRAADLGLNRARFTRRILEAALRDQPARRVDPPSEEELLDLLAEKARTGNVAAIRALLARLDETDPRARALMALEEMAEGSRQ